MKTKTIELQKQELFELMKSEKLSISDVIYLIKGKKRQLISSPELSDEIILTVDYSQNLEQMIKYCKLDLYEFEDCPFPDELINKEVAVFTKLYSFEEISVEDIVKKMNKDGYRPARIEELLALCKKFPKLQSNFPIAAIGFWSDAHIFRQMPVLTMRSSKRVLELVYLYEYYASDYRFLAVRK